MPGTQGWHGLDERRWTLGFDEGVVLADQDGEQVELLGCGADERVAVSLRRRA